MFNGPFQVAQPSSIARARRNQKIATIKLALAVVVLPSLIFAGVMLWRVHNHWPIVAK